MSRREFSEEGKALAAKRMQGYDSFAVGDTAYLKICVPVELTQDLLDESDEYESIIIAAHRVREAIKGRSLGSCTLGDIDVELCLDMARELIREDKEGRNGRT